MLAFVTMPDERLVDLMRDRGRQRAHGRGPGDVGELGASSVQGILGDDLLGHVLDRADEQGAAGDALDEVADGMDMLHGPARGDDAEDLVEVHAAERAREVGIERARSSGWMTSRTTWTVDPRRRVDLEDAVELVGPDVLVHHDVGGEVARLAEPLGVGEAVVRPPELHLGPLPVLDVRVDAVPLDDRAAAIAQRTRPEQEPAVLAVMATQPRLGLARRAGGQDLLPRGRQADQVLRVDGGGPAPSARLLRREADEVQVVPVEEVGAPVGPRRPDQRRAPCR